MLNPVLVSADIKADHVVAVTAEDQSALRLVCRPLGSRAPFKTFQMTHHVFGATSSPTACIYALQQTGRNCDSACSDIAELFEKWIYVDNLASSADSIEKTTHWTLVFMLAELMLHEFAKVMDFPFASSLHC